MLLTRTDAAGTEEWALPTDVLIIAENYASPDEAEEMAITLLQSSTAADVSLIKRHLRREIL